MCLLFNPATEAPKYAPGDMNWNVLCNIICNTEKCKQPRWYIHKNELELVVTMQIKLITYNIE